MPFVMSQIAKSRFANGTESNGINCIFTNKGNCGKGFWARRYYFKYSSHFFYKPISSKICLSTFSFKTYGIFAKHNSENLCPWSWPRPFLPLASIGSVLEKSVLGLGFLF